MKKKLAATDQFSSSHSTNPLRLPFAFHSLFFLGHPLSPFKCVSVALTQIIEPCQEALGLSLHESCAQ